MLFVTGSLSNNKTIYASGHNLATLKHGIEAAINDGARVVTIQADGHELDMILALTKPVPEINIIGYGNGKSPLLTGCKMGTAVDTDYAREMVISLAKHYESQWFGYSWKNEHDVMQYSDPIRYGMQTAK